jgi:hypothetical protein
MNEADFISKIDCSFPYEQPLAWRRLSTIAPRLSANAAFMVMHELCRVPRSQQVSKAQARKIIAHLKRRFRHPLLKVIQPAVDAHIENKKLSLSRAESLMRRVSKYPNQYNALALCYFAAYDRNDRLEASYHAAVTRWQEAHDAPDA